MRSSLRSASGSTEVSQMMVHGSGADLIPRSIFFQRLASLLHSSKASQLSASCSPYQTALELRCGLTVSERYFWFNFLQLSNHASNRLGEAAALCCGAESSEAAVRCHADMQTRYVVVKQILFGRRTRQTPKRTERSHYATRIHGTIEVCKLIGIVEGIRNGVMD